MKNRIIFHHPEPIPNNGSAGSQIRPYRMIEAFKNLGYDVDVIAGSGRNRREAIEEISNLLKHGIEYAFLYAESSTTPILLTERNHLPVYWSLDFNFFRQLKRNNIPLGLFYRDVQWRFDLYRRSVPIYKRIVTVPFYWYEWLRYQRTFDHLFLPSLSMYYHLPTHWADQRVTALPPGGVIYNQRVELSGNNSEEELQLFYVGGVTPPLYDLSDMTKAVKALPGVKLTLCCNRVEWEKNQSGYAIDQTESIQIVHASSNELFEHYSQSDIFSLYWRINPYLEFAMPIKIFEAIGYGLPIITTEGTEAARFIKSEGIGWCVSSPEQFKNLLLSIKDNPDEIRMKRARVLSIQKKHTWEQRALKVAEVLQNSSSRSKNDL